MGDVDIDVGLVPKTFIRLADRGKGTTVSASLSREALFDLVSQLMRGFAFLPPDGDAPQDPLFSIVDADVDAARSQDGRVLLTVRPKEMPPFEITLAPTTAAALSDALTEHAY